MKATNMVWRRMGEKKVKFCLSVFLLFSLSLRFSSNSSSFSFVFLFVLSLFFLFFSLFFLFFFSIFFFMQSNPIGALTTLDRDTWADVRAELVGNSVNAASLEQVDSALFAVCLEDQAPATLHDVSRCMLHGNGRNRWFDKSFQLIVTRNGRCAVNFEHAW